jgi:hypothetical protein
MRGRHISCRLEDEPAGRQGDDYETGVGDERPDPTRRRLLEGKLACQFIQAHGVK